MSGWALAARRWSMDDEGSSLEQTIAGRLLGAVGRTDTGGVSVWFAYETVDGKATTVMATSDDDGHFAFDLPPGPMRTAKVGAELLGVEPLDLEPNGDRLEPGDLVLIVDDGMPSHLRFLG